MTWFDDPGPAFLVGCRVGVREFRSSDMHGRPVDPAAEGETSRTERIEKLQARRVADGERTVPPVAPAEMLGEYFRLNPSARTGKLGMVLGERSAELLPSLMIELPGRDPEVYGPIYQRGRLVAGVVVTELPGR